MSKFHQMKVLFKRIITIKMIINQAKNQYQIYLVNKKVQWILQ